MPSSNGVYSLPSGYLAVTGATIQASQHNPPLEDIAAALTGRLSRDGTAAMTGPLQAAPGTVGAPGVVFSSDLTSGLYKTASGIGVSIGGVKVAEFVSGGVIGSRYVGELIPFTGTAAPSALTVLPFGQTLSRTGQPQLWAFAQIEIAAGNTFYNNGDGSLTFGIGDLRGRTTFGRDTMGGSAANRLTTAGGGVDGATMGAVGGAQSKTLLTSNLPPYTPSGSIAVNAVNLGSVSSTATISGGSSNNYMIPGANLITPTGSFSGNAQGGTSTPVQTMPGTVVTNYLLFAGA